MLDLFLPLLVQPLTLLPDRLMVLNLRYLSTLVHIKSLPLHCQTIPLLISGALHLLHHCKVNSKISQVSSPLSCSSLFLSSGFALMESPCISGMPEDDCRMPQV